jgi:hypothetical protein
VERLWCRAFSRGRLLLPKSEKHKRTVYVSPGWGSLDRYSTLPIFGFMGLQLKDKNYDSQMKMLLKEEERPYFICLNDDLSSSDEAFLAKATAPGLW